ncbi:MAG TPA: hypothetical protein VKP12_06415 [Kiloniellaceae bacterium]|nr:hypothetical protein [Kiloniellaceae bacterium]
MFAPATSKPSSPGFPSFDGILHFFAALAASFAATKEAGRVYERLARLSDSQLAARGLTRDDVNRLTLEALSGGLDDQRL